MPELTYVTSVDKDAFPSLGNLITVVSPCHVIQIDDLSVTDNTLTTTIYKVSLENPSIYTTKDVSASFGQRTVTSAYISKWAVDETYTYVIINTYPDYIYFYLKIDNTSLDYTFGEITPINYDSSSSYYRSLFITKDYLYILYLSNYAVAIDIYNKNFMPITSQTTSLEAYDMLPSLWASSFDNTIIFAHTSYGLNRLYVYDYELSYAYSWDMSDIEEALSGVWIGFKDTLYYYIGYDIYDENLGKIVTKLRKYTLTNGQFQFVENVFYAEERILRAGYSYGSNFSFCLIYGDNDAYSKLFCFYEGEAYIYTFPDSVYRYLVEAPTNNQYFLVREEVW